MMNQIGCHRSEPIILKFGPAILNGDVLRFNIARFAQSLTEGGQREGVGFGRSGCEIPDHRHRRLLRARCERPRSRRAAEQRDELAAPHSITSSAATSRPGGTVRPSAFAVLRLIVSSYLVGACTGK